MSGRKTSNRREVAGTFADPTLPKTPVEIGGKTYNLCFDLGALAEAETAINEELRRAGSDQYVNLLVALPVQTLMSTRILFAAAIRHFHPEIAFHAACDLAGPAELFIVRRKLLEAWSASTPEAEKISDPPQAGK